MRHHDDRLISPERKSARRIALARKAEARAFGTRHAPKYAPRTARRKTPTTASDYARLSDAEAKRLRKNARRLESAR